MKTLSYSNMKHTTRVPLILLTVEKIERENLDFVLLSFLFHSFSLHIAQQLHVYGTACVYERSAWQTTTLLSEIFFFLVRAACKLRWVNMHVSKRMPQFFLYAILCIITRTTCKLEVMYGCSTYRMAALLSEISIFCVRSGWEI